MTVPLLQSEIRDLPVQRGKVRDIYDLGETLLLVSTDRISAYDWVLPTGIPDKGRLLTQLSRFWFERLGTPHHMITTDVHAMDLPAGVDRQALDGRSMLVRKAQVVPIECVVRGYLAGSLWREYQQHACVPGLQLPAGLRESEALEQPLFTPATKAARGEHDENISFAETATRLGQDLAERLRRTSIEIYQRGAAHAREKGILIADTKFEFGLIDGELILVDEVLTPDSSRFWPADEYQPGGSQNSFDKQFVRDWLSTSGWDRNSRPPELPDEIVVRTREKYLEAYERLTGETVPDD